jgi:L-alanine-DL-glutamate epimerase-like enolase superfamily enzyme
MNRREFVKSAALASAVTSLPMNAIEAATGTPAGHPAVEASVVRLNLRHTWTTHMSSSQYRETLHVKLTRDGITGIGEGAPIVRYNEDAAHGKEAVESIRDLLTSASPEHYEKVMQEVRKRFHGNYAAQAAIDIALMDWFGKKHGLPLYRHYGLDAADAPLTTFSIGIDDPEKTRAKVEEAAAFPILKIKVGLDTDEATLAAVRAVTKKPLRVDANEGWKNKEEAVRKINWLESQGVEFIEQPLPAEMLEETKWVRSRVHMPIIADEACLNLASIPKLAESYDGVNIKLDKCGGMQQAYAMIKTAKAFGMKTMLGCMVSSSVSVTAAAHLSPLVDYADLDGNLLIANDPYAGVKVVNGKLVLPDGPGLGLTTPKS